ncbi:MAG: alpha/beta fold hydrolase [Candidatus Melainabacteria bacterium]|nr:alpha/beta fold hydrolase [Candidatus Melainabacteria bacterium]
MKTTSFKLPGIVLTGHEFQVPLDYAKPDGETITVFAREVVAVGKTYNEHLPWLIFFQGGPGFPSPRPTSKHGWLNRAIQDYRVLLLDQRGTGLSSPITFQTLARFDSPKKQADYLKHFRADSIVKDAEFIRNELLKDGQQWTALGQSYGGFCLAHYLSAAPEGLKRVIITGGLPPLTAHIDDIYRATYQRVLSRNELYYECYPMDVQRVNDIVAVLRKKPVKLPDGGVLTPERFQQLGIVFGMHEGFEFVHYLLEEAILAAKSNRGELSYTFLRGLEHAQAYETNPIYTFLHEAIYCQNFASDWSADRVRTEFPQFAPEGSKGRVLFTGEMISKSMFDDYEYLKPLKEAAEILATYKDWPTLYDVEKLQKNTVPTVAAVYYDDMYVETSYSEETATLIGNTRTWVTNEYEHNAIRADGDRILDRLLKMLSGEL